jgi:hypothetical protein
VPCPDRVICVEGTDDIDIVGKSLETVRDAYLALEAEAAKAAKAALKINVQKKKYMIVAGNRTISTLPKLWLLATGIFKSSNEFVYFGTLVWV